MHNPTQRTNFEVRVAAKEAKAALHGLTGVFMRLMEDHGRMAGLIQRALTAPDDEARVLLYLTIRSELVAHERGEHSVVYPALDVQRRGSDNERRGAGRFGEERVGGLDHLHGVSGDLTMGTVLETARLRKAIFEVLCTPSIMRVVMFLSAYRYRLSIAPIA